MRSVDDYSMKPELGASDFSLQGSKIWVAGERGMVGSALVRRLASEGCEIISGSRSSVDLTRQGETERWIARNRPDVVVIAAAKVGGIWANANYPVDFLDQNLAIALNVIHAAHMAGVRKLLFLGSTCIYPREAPQPISEDALLTGSLEATNEWYAIAKIAGVKLCQAYRQQFGSDFISAQPTNLYGPNDNYDLTHSHVLPALIAKIHNAKRNADASIVLWGTGRPRREFLHVDDLADALVFLLKRYSGSTPLNIGTGTDITILELAELIGEIVGWKGSFVLDASKPDGTPRKLLDVSRINNLGWRARLSLREGLKLTYKSFLSEVSSR